MTPVATKDLGENQKVGLNERVVPAYVTIDFDSEKIVVSYRVETIDPKGGVIAKSDPSSYERFNRPDELDSEGNIRIPGNMKYDQLRDSQAGQLIKGLLQMDFDAIKSRDTISDDLKQL